MACPRTARSPFPIAPARFSRSRGRASDEAKPARGRGETPPGIFPRNVGFQGFASRALFPTSPTGDRRRFQFCIERFQGLRRLFLQLSNFVILAVRQPEPRTVSCPPVYQILWVRGFRAHTIPGRGFNLFKPLRRHFRATPFCRQAPLAPRPQRPPLGSYATFRSNTCVFRRTFRGCLYDFNW